jgi:hypothetical protein
VLGGGSPWSHLRRRPGVTTGDRENNVQANGLNELRMQGRMMWIEEERGWIAAPEDIVKALSTDGFDECKREMTTSRRDNQPAGGVWQGVNPRTGSVASAVWVNHSMRPQAIMFITIDGASFRGASSPSPDRDAYRDDGGEA